MYTLLLGLLLMLLKYLEVDPVAQWSWWWVLSPFAVTAAWWAWAGRFRPEQAPRNGKARAAPPGPHQPAKEGHGHGAAAPAALMALMARCPEVLRLRPARPLSRPGQRPRHRRAARPAASASVRQALARSAGSASRGAAWPSSWRALPHSWRWAHAMAERYCSRVSPPLAWLAASMRASQPGSRSCRLPCSTFSSLSAWASGIRAGWWVVKRSQAGSSQARTRRVRPPAGPGAARRAPPVGAWPAPRCPGHSRCAPAARCHGPRRSAPAPGRARCWRRPQQGP